jgi:hypothetical protein
MTRTQYDRTWDAKETAAALVEEQANGTFALRSDVTPEQVEAMGLTERVEDLLRQLNE